MGNQQFSSFRTPLVDQADAQWMCFPLEYSNSYAKVCNDGTLWGVCIKAYKGNDGKIRAAIGLAIENDLEFTNVNVNAAVYKANGVTSNPFISLLTADAFLNEVPGYEQGIFSMATISAKNAPTVVIDKTGYGAFVNAEAKEGANADVAYDRGGFLYADKVAYYFTKDTVTIGLTGEHSCTVDLYSPAPSPAPTPAPQWD